MLKRSNYNIVVDKNHDGGYLYNTFSASLLKFDKNTMIVVKKILENPNRCLYSDENKIKNTLIAQGFLVENSIDEFKVLKLAYQATVLSPEKFGLTLAPTYDCNFKCPYCYQKNKNKSTMSNETILGIIKFLERRELSNCKRINLVWYGGEPLLSLNEVVKLQTLIMKLAEKKNIKLFTHMVTNGFLLNNDNWTKIQKLGIDNFQITLDGPREYHNMTRVLLNGDPTYDKIIENIMNLINSQKPPRINIRTNISRNNLDAYYLLTKELENYGLLGKVHLNPSEIYDVNNCIKNKDEIFKRSEYQNNIFNIKKELSRKGWDISGAFDLSYFDGNHCGADCYYALLVGANGMVYKCWDDLGVEEKSIGSINDS
jgi:uncharacterized protein